MSAWLVFAALGLYPVTPGDGLYTLTAPVFPRAQLQVGNAIVHIEAPGAPKARYITAARWNGKPLDTARLAHAQLVQGGWLELTLGEQHGDWATQGGCAVPGTP